MMFEILKWDNRNGNEFNPDEHYICNGFIVRLFGLGLRVVFRQSSLGIDLFNNVVMYQFELGNFHPSYSFPENVIYRVGSYDSSKT